MPPIPFSTPERYLVRGWYAEFFDYVDDLPAEERGPFEDTLVGSLDRSALFGTLRVATRAFLAEFGRAIPGLPPG